MKACVVHGRGDLRIDELPVPEPEPGQLLVAVEYGGICGSDLHYYHDGAAGDFRVVEPLVLGHEIVGRVASVGASADSRRAGVPVAVHPATPCGDCPECRAGRRNICRNARYLGSAARRPHVQGGFAEFIAVRCEQARFLPEGIDLARAALAEPLSVALHAVRRAGPVAGAGALVVGAGPIGCLVVAALHQGGAAWIAATDLADAPLEVARAVGATHAVRADRVGSSSWPDAVDVAFEASGSVAGLRTCVESVRRGGTVVLLGLLPPGEVGLLGNLVVTRELELRGAFRFDEEFDTSVQLLVDGLDVEPVVTHRFPLSQAHRAFDIASDRSVASKVLLDLRQ